jgi:hypothetical protein
MVMAENVLTIFLLVSSMHVSRTSIGGNLRLEQAQGSQEQASIYQGSP